jgi:Methyltransferase domain
MADSAYYWQISREKLPGPEYYSVLQTIHYTLKPNYYLEIGISSGASLALALENSYAVGVDPKIAVIFPLRAWTKLYQSTSDQFFDKYYGDLFDLIFIDGLHTFDAVVKDFCHAEELCSPSTVMLIHDTIPLFKETSQPPSENEDTPSFWTGDVWKLIPALIKGRPDLKIFTIPCLPSGITVIQGFSEEPKGLSQEIIQEFKSKDFEWISPQWESILKVVPNDSKIWQPYLKTKI